jgi:hypothetical protein
MFIVSTKKFRIRRPERPVYDIPKGFVGDIPDDIAKEWIIQEAIKEGSISTPASKGDRSIDKAIAKSEEKAKANQKTKESKRGK